MKREAHAESNIGIPADTLNKSRKYQTAAGIPASELENAEASGNKGDNTATKPVVTKNSAKNSTNLTTTDRRMKPRAKFSAEARIANTRSPYAAKIMNSPIAIQTNAITAYNVGRTCSSNAQ